MKKKSFILIILFVVLCIIIGMVWQFSMKFFMKAVYNGDIEEAQRFMKNPMVSKNLNSSFAPGSFLDDTAAWETPLSVACSNSDFEMAKLLIEYGADPKDPINESDCLIRSVILEYDVNDIELLKLLESEGLNLDGGIYRDEPDQNFLQIVSNINTYKFIEEKNSSDDAVVEYNKWKGRGITDEYRYLYKKAKIKEFEVNDGITTLMYAVLHQNLDLIKYILDNGIENINEKDTERRNCIFYITPDEETAPYYDKEWRKATVDMLISYGVDLTVKDRYGKTAYDYAVENGDSYLAELIKP